MAMDVDFYVNFEPSPIDTANASMLNANARIITSITFIIPNQCTIFKNSTLKTKSLRLILKIFKIFKKQKIK